MPPLSELPGDLSKNKLLKALRRIGFLIDESGGNGSHVMVTWPLTNKSTTIPYQTIPKQTLKYLVKQIENITLNRITWKDIDAEL